jgi:putative ABC transport system permease protein
MWQDIRYAFRMLQKSKAATFVCILSLSLCIGAITAIYSVIHAVILRPFPYPDTKQLAVLWNHYPGLEHAAISVAEFADYREILKSIEEIVAFTDVNRNLTGNGEPERLQGFLVSPNLFHMLGIRPELGRDFVKSDGATEKNQFVLLSHDLWKRRFGLDRSIIGKSIYLDSKPYVVLGILPKGIRFPDVSGFQFPERADLWIPLSWEQRRSEPRGDQYLRVLVRLKHGVSIQKAQAELDQIAPNFRKTYKDHYGPHWKPIFASFEEQATGDIRPALWLLFFSASLVLFIACTNVAHLKLAQASERRKETSVRIALGANRHQLIRQFLMEGLILSVISGIAGSFLALWAVRMIVRMAPTDIPRIDTVNIDASVLFFTILISFLAGIFFGILPAVQRTEVQNLKNTVGAPSHHGYQKFLVILQTAFAVIVLISASLLFKSFREIQKIDPGWKSEKVLTFYVPLPRGKYTDGPSIQTFYETFYAKLAALPGTIAVGSIYPLPLCGDTWSGSYEVENHPVPSGQPPPHASYASASGDPFRALSIHLIEGRNFRPSDTRANPSVAMIDEALAKRHWPGQSAVGKRMNIIGANPIIWTNVVGVVSHIRTENLLETGEPQIYLPAAQVMQRSSFITVRSDAPLAMVIAASRKIAREIDPDQPLAKIHPMQDWLTQAQARRRFHLQLLSLFAFTAIVLAASGIYGMMAFAVNQRTREIGLRMALGAHRRQMQQMILKTASVLSITGMLSGTILILAFRRFLTSFLYNISSNDPLTIVFVWVILAVTALLASYIPAYRASRIDPAITLRYE